jgi:hypothetical protein
MRKFLYATTATAIVLGLPYDMPVRVPVVKLDVKRFAALEGDYKTADGGMLKH